MISRRSVLKAVFTGGAIAGLGVMMPRIALAAWNATAFETDSQDAAMGAMYDSAPAASADVNLKAPDIAENGAVVPITIQADLPNVESISLLVDENPNPLAAHYKVGKGLRPYVSTRIKMGKTSAVHAVVKADGQLMKTTKEIKVTIGGCGG